jgi:hypothetical protein
VERILDTDNCFDSKVHRRKIERTALAGHHPLTDFLDSRRLKHRILKPNLDDSFHVRGLEQHLLLDHNASSPSRDVLDYQS